MAIEIRDVGVNELDEAIGKDRYVSKIVNGHRKKPGAPILQMISKHLRIDHAWLVTGEGVAPTGEDDLNPPPPVRRLWRIYPEWPAARALALEHWPNGMPVIYLDEVGEMAPRGDRSPTWPMIHEMARTFWLDDIARSQRETEQPAPPSAIVPSDIASAVDVEAGSTRGSTSTRRR